MLHIAGSGGFGRETFDAILAGVAASGSALPPIGFLDDARAGETVRGLSVLHPDEVDHGEYVVGIADPIARRRMVDRLEDSE